MKREYEPLANKVTVKLVRVTDWLTEWMSERVYDWKQMYNMSRKNTGHSSVSYKYLDMRDGIN